MVVDEKKAVVKQVVLETLALESPLGLAMLDSPWFEAPAHIKLLNDSLLRVVSGEVDRLAVFMPPRHGKSELCSKYLPAWFLGAFPDKRVFLLVRMIFVLFDGCA